MSDQWWAEAVQELRQNYAEMRRENEEFRKLLTEQDAIIHDLRIDAGKDEHWLAYSFDEYMGRTTIIGVFWTKQEAEAAALEDLGQVDQIIDGYYVYVERWRGGERLSRVVYEELGDVK